MSVSSLVPYGSYSLSETLPLSKLESPLQEIEVKTSNRTPRKSANPQHTPLREEKDDSALLSFKLVNGELTPELELNITTSTPVHGAKEPKAKRRLWGGTCDPVKQIDLDIKQDKSPKIDSQNSSSRNTTPSDPEDDEGSIDREPFKPTEISMETGQKCYSLKCSRHSGKSKTCASCNTKKTPLWRDADDGTPYCNACGIRFKKYRVRCPACLYVPRKDEKTADNTCFMCGSQLVRCRFNNHVNNY